MMIFPMKVKYMVVIFIAIEFLASINQTHDQISNITHLGGMAFGGIYLFFLKKGLTISNLKYKIKYSRARKKLKVLDKKDNDSAYTTLH
jgi:membrane associated rhomboid family serine protease